MGGAAAVALLAATRRRPATSLYIFLSSAARAGLHDAAAPAEEKANTCRRRRSSTNRLLGRDIPDACDPPPRAAPRLPHLGAPEDIRRGIFEGLLFGGNNPIILLIMQKALKDTSESARSKPSGASKTHRKEKPRVYGANYDEGRRSQSKPLQITTPLAITRTSLRAMLWRSVAK
ncbi:hypothetical protein GUJ93_ZPchr0001g32773 [Zizania palustris]|uniref:Uncharacterized protein n=1 Tax=Zizania palustris TaxID=103762 RepID=A0A8J5VBS1_ZIZPA|nr:hypothetical protein GUJ93_ZPchr0001g32773 [Zizania palustris]